MNIRVMSYNICSGRDHSHADRRIDIRAAGEAIRRFQPDIVGLNEVRGPGADPQNPGGQAHVLASMLGYYSWFAEAIELPGVGAYGNALLSRYPIRSAETIAIPDAPVVDDAYYETRCVLRARVRIPAVDELVFLVTHVGLADGEKDRAMDTVAGLVAAEQTRLVLLGDLNMTPDDARHGRLKAWLSDTADGAYGGDRLLTFPADAPDRKIDYIYVSAGIGVQDVSAPGITVSDHRPYLADLEV